MFFAKCRKEQPSETRNEGDVLGRLAKSSQTLDSKSGTSKANQPDVTLEITDIATGLENIIAFVNLKSGGAAAAKKGKGKKDGQSLLDKLRAFLIEENVFDLSQGGPKLGLEKHRNNPELIVICCGGDGTAGWILSVLDDLRFEKRPPIAIMPLGTGNDLSRVMGWGGGIKKGLAMDTYMRRVVSGNEVLFDRWKMNVRPFENVEQEIKEKAVLENAQAVLPLAVMNNYFSFGADAKVALDFHAEREKKPGAFKSPLQNKIKYATSYSKDLIQQSSKRTVQSIRVFECDGVSILHRLQAQKYHSILVLNIASYAGGTNPWDKQKEGFEPQSFSDGLLEVVGFHAEDLMWIRIGVPGDSLCQAERIRIVTQDSLPMQVDGEPCFLQPSEIVIELKNKVPMIFSQHKIVEKF